MAHRRFTNAYDNELTPSFLKWPSVNTTYIPAILTTETCKELSVSV